MILLASTLVVARAVGVAAYGLFALGLVFYQAGLLVRDAGLGQALIILGATDASMTWRTFVGASSIGILVAGLIAGMSEGVTSALGLPQAAPFVAILAIAFGVGSLGVASNAALERDLRFKARAVIEVSSYVALGVVTVCGLVLGWGAIALACGYVAQGAVQATLAIILVPPWRHRAPGTVRFRVFARYGGFLWVSSVLTYVATNVDNVAVAALGGAAAIGVYALSYTLGTMIAISLAQVLNRVALPYFARASDGARRLAIFTSIAPLSTALAVLAAAPVIVLAPEIGEALLGSAAPFEPLAILAAYGVARAAGIAVGTALNGSGAARSVTVSAVLNATTIVLMVVPAFRVGGIIGVAVMVLGSAIATLLVLRRPTHQLGASLAFLTLPAIGVGTLVVLVANPVGAAPGPLRVAAGVAAMLMAARWAWQIVRSRRVVAVTGAGSS